MSMTTEVGQMIELRKNSNGLKGEKRCILRIRMQTKTSRQIRLERQFAFSLEIIEADAQVRASSGRVRFYS